MSVQPGTRLGPYEIVAPIGAGGMGEVFRARDTRIGRDVALKILPGSFSADAELLRRFELETQAIGALNHPNLVTIYDLGSHDGSPYFVMELLEGETLRAVLSPGNGSENVRLPLRKAIDYAIQLANGLASAHEKGVVHRDLKPENIFITRDGRVKILDFGLARVTRGSEAQQTGTGPTLQKGVTSPGTVLGTVGYMSPEQVRGQVLDHRSDIFSFGAVLYEMLAGTRAFKGVSAADVMSAILKDDPPEIRDHVPAVDPAIDQLIQHCLEKDREQRFQSARDLAFDLKRLSGVSGSSPRTAAGAAPLRARWIRAAGPALAAAAVAAAIGFLTGRMTAPASRATALKLTPLTYEGGVEEQPAFAPDGSSFLYVGGPSGNLDVYLRRIGGENAINLTEDSADDDYDPAFSPDGQQIAFRSERQGGGIFLMGATGESVRRLTDFGFRPAWSPDGKELVIQSVKVLDPTNRPRESQIWRVNAVTGEKKQIEAAIDAVDPRWSPDGTRLAFWGLPRGTGERVIYTVAATGGTPAALTDDAYFNWNPVWSPDGKYLYFSSNRNGTTNIWRIPVDQKSGAARGELEPVTASAHASSSVSLSRDGTRFLYVAGATSTSIDRVDITSASRAGELPARTLLRDSRHLHYLACSADNQWLAFRAGLAPEDLFVVKTDGTGLRRLTNDAAKNRVPHWSADGRFVYFMSDRSGRYEIWRIRSDGSALEQLTTTTGANVGDPRVSPDGRKLAVVVYGQQPARRGAIVNLELPLAQRKLEMLPLFDGLAFTPEAWSPDSSRLVGSVTTPEGRVMATAIWSGGKYERMHLFAEDGAITLQGGAGLHWSADGSRLFFNGGNKLMVTDLSTKASREVLPLPENAVAYALSADGSSLYLVRRESESDIWMAELGTP